MDLIDTTFRLLVNVIERAFRHLVGVIEGGEAEGFRRSYGRVAPSFPLRKRSLASGHDHDHDHEYGWVLFGRPFPFVVPSRSLAR